MQQSTTNTTDAVSRYADPRCHICGGTGWIDWRNKDGLLFARYCDCFKRRRQIQNLTASGLTRVSKYTLETFKTAQHWQERMKERALAFVEEPGQKWFYIGGQPGAGKTHLCTGICIELINQGRAVRYEVWPELSARLKTYRNENDYIREMAAIKNAQVLYIDDLFKGKITEADKQIAWEIINARYAADRQTIISSELHTSTIARIDQAISGRISQMASGYVLNLADDPTRDQRTQEQEAKE